MACGRHHGLPTWAIHSLTSTTAVSSESPILAEAVARMSSCSQARPITVGGYALGNTPRLLGFVGAGLQQGTVRPHVQRGPACPAAQASATPPQNSHMPECRVIRKPAANSIRRNRRGQY